MKLNAFIFQSPDPLFQGGTYLETRKRENTMRKKSHYNKKHKHLARKLRKNGTLGEAILWEKVLRARQCHGLQFNRQFPIDRYITDFICRRLKIIIEIDGSSHRFKQEEDRRRDERLAELGYRTIRFTESEVRNDIENVKKAIESIIASNERELL